MGFLPSFTSVQLILGGMALLIALGFGLTLGLGVMKALLWLLQLSSQLTSHVWRWLRHQPLDSHGTSHFADGRDVERAGFYTHPEHLPLAQYDGKVLYEPTGGSVALIAPPRSHKSWGVLMPCIRAFRGSVVVHDPRGELYEHTHTEREAVGPVIRFDPANKMSAAIDPLHLIRWKEDQQHGDLQRVSLSLLSPEPGEAMSEYALEAVPLLTALLIERHAAGQQGIGAVGRFLVDPMTSLKQKFDSLLKHPHPTVAQAARRMADKSEARQAAVVQHLLQSLNPWSDPLIDMNTSSNDLDLMECMHGAQPVSVYLCSEFADLPRLKALFSCLIAQLCARFGSPGEKRHTVLFALDEAMALGRIEPLESGMSHFAGDGIQVLLAFQNAAQCARVYGPHSPLRHSIPTSMYFCPVNTDLTTREEISQILGVTTTEYATRSQRVSAWGLLQSETLGAQRLERRLMTSDEVGQMEEERCILVTKAHPPVLARKLDAPPLPVLSLPQRYTRPALAASVAALLLLSVWTVGHFARIGASPTPAPHLSLTSDSPAPLSGSGGMEAPADRREPMSGVERLALRLDVRGPWVLTSQQGSKGFMIDGGLMSGLPSGRFDTQEACQRAMSQGMQGRILSLRQMAAVQQGMRVEVIERPNYISTSQAYRGLQAEVTTSTCHLHQEAE